MSTLSYPPLYAAVFVLQALAIAAVAFSRLDPAQAFPVFFLWTTCFAAALAFGHSLARRSYVPRGVAQFAPLALAAATVGLWLFVAGPIYVVPVAALGLLLGRDMLLTTRRGLYFDLAIVLTLFYDAIAAPYLPHPWPFCVAFLLALMLVLVSDYTDRRLAYIRAAGAPAPAEFFPGLRNAVFATAMVLVVAVPIYWVMPQPRPLGLALLPGSVPAKWSYDNPASFGAGRRPDGGGTGGSRGEAGQTPPGSGGGAGTGVPPRLDITRSGLDGARGDGQAGGTGGGSGDTQGKGSGDSQGKGAGDRQGKGTGQVPLLLFYMDADRPLYLRVRAYVLPLADEWVESPHEPARQPGRGIFMIRDGRLGRNTVTQRFMIAAPLDDRIPVAYRPTQIAFPARSIQFSYDMTLQAAANLVPDTEYGARSELLYLGERPSGDAEEAPPSGYLITPVRVSPRVAALVQTIVETRITPREKAEALESHLRSAYQRGPFRSAQDVPDPTAQFLFEQGQGGSAQFANALAIMLRSAGIPARIIGGYRARRLNPLHGGYEIWSTDRHYWVEAYLEVSWVTFEPSPWAALPARRKPDNALEAAREYVRLAKELPDPAPDGKPVPAPLIPAWYLRLVLAWGWLATYGHLLLLGLLAFAAAAWRWRRLLRPLHDAVDRWRLRLARRRAPARLVLAAFATVERVSARRGLGRAATENHAEYLARLAACRPYLRTQINLLAAVFAAARYGATEVPGEEAARAALACDEIAELIDETTAVAAR